MKIKTEEANYMHLAQLSVHFTIFAEPPVMTQPVKPDVVYDEPVTGYMPGERDIKINVAIDK